LMLSLFALLGTYM